MLIRYFPVLFFSVAMSLLSGCASNSALTLMEVSKHRADVIAPSAAVIERELKGRAFTLGDTKLDDDATVRIPAGYADGFFRRLMRKQLEKGFSSAALDKGDAPAFALNIFVEEMKFTNGRFLIPDPSILRVRMELRSPDGRTLMKGELESRQLPTMPFAAGGVVGAVAIAGDGEEWVAVAKMIPAMAVAITRTMAGLKAGKGLEQIEIYPELINAGSIIMPDLFLRGSPYGLSQLTNSDLQSASEGR